MNILFKAIKDGRLITKKIQAESEEAVILHLKNEGYFPILVKKEAGLENLFIGSFFNHVNFSDIVNFTRQLSIMLNAGLTLIDCLSILKKQTTKQSFLNLLDLLEKEIRSGSSLSSALSNYPNYFSNLYIALVKSGEASGKLSEILLKLADNLEKQREFRGKLKGTLIYPIIVISAMIGVMFIMITFVIPKLLNLYKDFNINLPITTQFLIAISNFSAQYWPLIIISAGFGGFFLRNYMQTKQGKAAFDSFILKIPVISNVIKISSLVDATRTLSILIGSGVSILDSLNIIVETTSNTIYRNAFKNIHLAVEKGISLGTAMQNEEIFPPILVQMTIVGEQTGHLDETLGRIANFFEMESELAFKALTTMIEPLILVVLGVGVGFLVMSVITPIYNLTSSLK